MKRRVGVILPWLLILASLSVIAISDCFSQETVVLDMTGEDIADVVAMFNRSQTDYQVVIQNHSYRNWRYAVNKFRFTQKKSVKGDVDRIIDIAFVDNNWLTELIHYQWLEDLSGHINKEIFIDELLEPASEKDGLYGLPFSTKGLVLFCRRDLHEKYTLPFPRTLEDLEKNGMFLMEAEQLDHGVTIHYSALHLDLLPFLWSNGGGVIVDGRLVLDSTGNRETLNKLQGMARHNLFPGPELLPALQKTYGHAKELFMTGRSAYLISWTNRTTDLNRSPIAGKYAILPLPTLKHDQQNYSMIGTWYFAVNRYSDHKQGAISFLNYFYSDEIQSYLSRRSTGFIPATRTRYRSSAFVKEHGILAVKAIENMRHRLMHLHESRISFILENTFRQIIFEMKPVADMLAISQERI
ncbi:ABC transporter substrate-binding protein, partial [Thermodesulfobacteriota bacterium]